MAYSGTTAATSVSNPPRKMVEGIAGNAGTTGLTTAPSNVSGQGGAMWFYSSTNLTTDLVAGGFFSDGKSLGMRPGDMVFGVQFSSAGSSCTTFQGAIIGVSSTGASLSTGSLITSTFG